MSKQNRNKNIWAIFCKYSPNILRKILDLEKWLQKTTALNRNGMLGILICCVIISGTIVSFFKKSAFVPLSWIINGIFSFRGIFITMILFCIMILFIYIIQRIDGGFQNEYDEERNLTKSAYGTHGTASFLEGEEIKQVYGLHHKSDIHNLNGFVIGKVPNIAQNIGYIGNIVTRDEDLMKKQHLSNRNTVILGSPGTGKSASIMIQNLIESAKRGESVFATDPKGELCDETYPIFKEYGYDVKVFNLIYPWHSNKWNFMEWLATLGAEREKWIATISSMIIKNTSGEKQDEFWASTADKLLKALMSVLIEIAAPKAKIKDEKLEEFEKQLKQLRQERKECETIEEHNKYDAQIVKVIREKYEYLRERLKQLKQMIDTCQVPSEKQRLMKLYKKIQTFHKDEMLLERPRGDIEDISEDFISNNFCSNSLQTDDYEPLTIAEAKRRILNISTCVKLLQLRISPTQEERAELKRFNAIPRHEKIQRLLYELVFQVPLEKRKYKALMQVFALNNPNYSLAYSYWSSFTESSENVCTSVKGGLDTRLSAFNQYYIQQMVSENEIDLEKPGREKCAYFCIISDQETSLSYISSLFITIAFATLQTQADANRERKLNVRTTFYLDEFANIGVLPDYTKKLSTLRSRDIHITMAIQNIPQLLQRYDENLCLEMFGDCDLMLFLGCGNEAKTPEFVSKLMGQMTTRSIIKRESKNIFSPIKDFEVGLTEQQGQRDLMYINEIRELKQNRLIALTRGQKPMQVDKYMYFERPDYEEIEKIISDHPVISGHPLPKEKQIDLQTLFSTAQEQPPQDTQNFSSEDFEWEDMVYAQEQPINSSQAYFDDVYDENVEKTQTILEQPVNGLQGHFQDTSDKYVDKSEQALKQSANGSQLHFDDVYDENIEKTQTMPEQPVNGLQGRFQDTSDKVNKSEQTLKQPINGSQLHFDDTNYIKIKRLPRSPSQNRSNEHFDTKQMPLPSHNGLQKNLYDAGDTNTPQESLLQPYQIGEVMVKSKLQRKRKTDPNDI